MFPIPWNRAFRKKDGTLVNMEDIAGGGSGGELPEHSSADAGKVLGVDDDGSLGWMGAGSLNLYLVTTNQMIAQKIYVLTTVEDDITSFEKLKIALTTGIGFVVSGTDPASSDIRIPVYTQASNEITGIKVYLTDQNGSSDKWRTGVLMNTATVHSTKIF